MISRLVDRPSSAALREGGESSPRGRGSRPNSVLSGGQLSGENVEAYSPSTRAVSQSIATQTTNELPELALHEPPPAPKPEIVTYSKGVQTDTWVDPEKPPVDEDADASLDSGEEGTSRANKHLSRRERERDEEIRESLRKEIEEEVKATQDLADGGGSTEPAGPMRYPLRTLTEDELHAVTLSGDFLDFMDRSSKVIERALDEEYDVLADYGLGGVGAEEDEDEDYRGGKKRRELKQTAQFWDERWSKKRMISDISFSPKVCMPSFLFFSRRNYGWMLMDA